jgi:DNA-binding transcriptional ArsR family regulator
MHARLPSSAKLDATFAALADPTRRAIVARLAGGEATVLELAEPFDISLPAISRHLKVLEQAGLIERGRDAQRRPCRLRGEALGEVVQWAEHTKRAWQERFDRLGAYLEQMKAQADSANTHSKTHSHTKENRRDRRKKR